MRTLDVIALLLAAAAIIGTANERLFRIAPAFAFLLGSLCLSIAAIAVDPLTHGVLRPGLRHALDGLDLPRLFLDGILGLLLFATSLHVSVAGLRDNKWTILLLATGSVILSTALFCFGLHWICRLIGIDLPLRWCGVIGAILAPTDAVVVDGIVRRVALPRALHSLISGESLLNDGAGVVLFIITLKIADGGPALFGHGEVLTAILVASAGGAILGIAAGFVVARAMPRGAGHGASLLLTLALVFACYRGADALHVSGPIAVAAAGLTLGSALRDAGGIAPPVLMFWTLLDEVLNALLFLLIGLDVVTIPLLGIAWSAALAAIPLAVIARCVSVSAPVLLAPGGAREKSRRVAVLGWAGMRGGVSIAMVLATEAGRYRDELMAICFAVVLFTILVQGATLPWVIRRIYGSADPTGDHPDDANGGSPAAASGRMTTVSGL